MQRILKNRMFVSVSLSVVLTFVFVYAVVYSSSTISTNISTGGTLTVSSTATITGLTSMNGNASTTILSTTGNLLVNGWATTTGSNGNFATEGTLYVTSSTTLAGLANVGGALTVTGLAKFNANASTTILSTTGNLLVNGWATTTGSNGNFATEGTLYVTSSTTLAGLANVGGALNVSGNIGKSTSTPSEEISATGSGTTTLFLHSSTAAKGGCIELKGPGTNYFRLYATAAGVATWESGTCAGITTD